MRERNLPSKLTKETTRNGRETIGHASGSASAKWQIVSSVTAVTTLLFGGRVLQCVRGLYVFALTESNSRLVEGSIVRNLLAAFCV